MIILFRQNIFFLCDRNRQNHQEHDFHTIAAITELIFLSHYMEARFKVPFISLVSRYMCGFVSKQPLCTSLYYTPTRRTTSSLITQMFTSQKGTAFTSRLHLSDIFFNSLSLASTQKTCFSFHLLTKMASFFVVSILSKKSQNDKRKRSHNFFPGQHKLPFAFSSKCPALHWDFRTQETSEIARFKVSKFKIIVGDV